MQNNNSQMTKFSAVMQNIVTYKDVSQPYCLSALVGFLSKIYTYPLWVLTVVISLLYKLYA